VGEGLRILLMDCVADVSFGDLGPSVVDARETDACGGADHASMGIDGCDRLGSHIP
jgi:hypothetical protein